MKKRTECLGLIFPDKDTESAATYEVLRSKDVPKVPLLEKDEDNIEKIVDTD